MSYLKKKRPELTVCEWTNHWVFTSKDFMAEVHKHIKGEYSIFSGNKNDSDIIALAQTPIEERGKPPIKPDPYKEALQFYVVGCDLCDNVYHLNVFDNIHVFDGVVNALKQYEKDKDFDNLVKKVKQIVKWQMFSRVRYEISAGQPFPRSTDDLTKIDAWWQFEPNAELVMRGIVNEIFNGN